MFNYESPTIQNMIQNGQLGTTAPIQQSYVDQGQYFNNMIPIGQYNYNNYQPQYGYVNQGQMINYQQPQYDYYANQSMAINGDYGYQQYQLPYFVQPIMNYGYQYQQPMMYNDQQYVNQPMYNQAQYQQQYTPIYSAAPMYQNNENYWDPYGTMANQQMYGGYNQPFSIDYRFVDPEMQELRYMSPMQIQKYQDSRKEFFKTKYRMVEKYFGRECDEDKLENIVNPKPPKEPEMSQEEIINRNEYRRLLRLEMQSRMPIMYETPEMITARYLNQASTNFHKEFDNHSLFQFLNDDLWKLQREYWIAENINFGASRNLARTYNKDDYTELLKMHYTGNPYADEIMNESIYDNNSDDTELGLMEVFDKARRRMNILEGKVPKFISSPKVQKQREEFTKKLMEQVYAKRGGISV